MGLTIGVDIGGTKILAGTVTEDGTVGATARRPTPRNDASDVLDLVAEAVRVDEGRGVGIPVEAADIGDAAEVLPGLVGDHHPHAECMFLLNLSVLMLN